MFRDRLLEQNVIPSAQAPRPQYWFDVALGRSNIALSNILDTSAGRIGIRVYLGNRIAEAALAQLEKDKVAIENEIGETLSWNPTPETIDKIIGLFRSVDISRRDAWPEFCDWLEMVSKPPQGDERCGEVEQRTIHGREPFMTNQQPPKAAEPGHRALNDPAPFVAAQQAPVFVAPGLVVVAIRHDDRDPAPAEPLAQRVAVIGAIRDQSGRRLAGTPGAGPRDTDGVQCRVDECDFGGAGRGDVYSQRYTLAVDHHHPLRALAALGFPDVRAPFFADTNEPSMNTFSHWIRPRASSWPRKVRHRRSQVPSSCHCRRRRQQVDPLGYPSGRSRHRAPVFNTQRIPSTTSRLLTRGRPPFTERRGRGRCGSILTHCASVSRTLRLATSTSGQRSTARREKVQVLIASVNGF